MSVDKANTAKENINIGVKFPFPNDKKSQGEYEKREAYENRKKKTISSNTKENSNEKEVIETQFSNILIICPK